MNTQVRNSFDTETIQKIIRGALIAGGGAFLIYLLTWLTTIELGVYTPMAVAVAGILINAVKEYMKGEGYAK